MEEESSRARKQALIYIGIAFALPFALGLPMGIGYSQGIDLSAFPNAQMLYPAAGVIVAALVTRKHDHLIPKRFFYGFLVTAGFMLLCSLASFVVPDLPWNLISQIVLIAASVTLLVLLLTEKKEKRIAYGLVGKNWLMSVLIVVLYLVIYFTRTGVAYVAGGQTDLLVAILQDPITWISLVTLPLNYFLVFSAFFGEEYGWRYYLQPVLQKRFGPIVGILVLGVVWGLWHLPINFFYYSSPSVGLISVAGQLVTCITLGAFYGWAYLKTNNIWTVVILHFVNNNLVPIITGNYSMDVLENQEPTWESVLAALIINGVLFLWVFFSKYYRDRSLRLPTMDERADEENRRLVALTTPPQGPAYVALTPPSQGSAYVAWPTQNQDPAYVAQPTQNQDPADAIRPMPPQGSEDDARQDNDLSPRPPLA